MPLEKLYLELTDACNLNCEMCYRKTWGNIGAHMPPAILKTIIDELTQKGIEYDGNPLIKEIVLGGIGEPTIHPDFYSVLEQLKEMDITLTTNGTTIDEKMADALVDYVDKLVVSVDGSQLVYDRIRGFDYNQLMSNLQRLNEAKEKAGKRTPALFIQMVVSKGNLDEVLNVIEISSQIHASGLILSNLLPVTLEDKDSILYTQNDPTEMKSYFNRIRNRAMRVGLDIKLTESKLKTDRRCNFIEKSAMVINARGEIVPCYRFAHHGTEVVFGRIKTIEKVVFGKIGDNSLQSINKKSLKDLWDDAAYRAFRQMVHKNHYPSCPDCDLVDGCDFVRTTAGDCYGNRPSCSDCLWSRNIIYCV